MDKNTFLKELERSLSVLQEDEIRDIISEYEQHIDMKVQNGQTEEQAIADFGSLSELTADILEAYHVRADYAEKKEKRFSFAEGEKGRTGASAADRRGVPEDRRRTDTADTKIGERAEAYLLQNRKLSCRCRRSMPLPAWTGSRLAERSPECSGMQIWKQESRCFAGEHRLLAGAYEEHSRRREKAGGFMTESQRERLHLLEDVQE